MKDFCVEEEGGFVKVKNFDVGDEELDCSPQQKAPGYAENFLTKSVYLTMQDINHFASQVGPRCVSGG